MFTKSFLTVVPFLAACPQAFHLYPKNVLNSSTHFTHSDYQNLLSLGLSLVHYRANKHRTICSAMQNASGPMLDAITHLLLRQMTAEIQEIARAAGYRNTLCMREKKDQRRRWEGYEEYVQQMLRQIDKDLERVREEKSGKDGWTKLLQWW